MIKRMILYLIIFFIIFIFYAKYLERKSIFYPCKEIIATPLDCGLAYEDVHFTTEDNLRINGWLVSKQGARYTILFFHGNAGNISHRLDKLKILYDIGVNIFIIDYRGYGKSEGKPSESGLYSDSKAAYNYLVHERKVNPQAIILYGESLGSAVAMDLAVKEKTAGIITEVAFSNIRDMAKIYYPYIPSFLISARFDSLAKIPFLSVPKLFILCETDEIVPFNLGKKLYDIALEPKRLIVLKGSHNTAFLDSIKEYVSGIASFVKDFE